MTSGGTVSFWRRTLLHGVNYIIYAQWKYVLSLTSIIVIYRHCIGSWARSFRNMTDYRLKYYSSDPHSAWIFILPHFQTSSRTYIISCQVCSKVWSHWFLNLTARLPLRVKVKNVCCFASNSQLIFKGWLLRHRPYVCFGMFRTINSKKVLILHVLCLFQLVYKWEIQNHWNRFSWYFGVLQKLVGIFWFSLKSANIKTNITRIQMCMSVHILSMTW